MKQFAIAWAVFRRTWIKVARRPAVLLLSFVQPLIWMTFFGFLFHRFALGELEGQVTYIEFLTPGVCVMTVLLGASQSGAVLIRDMQTGFLQRMAGTPAAGFWLLSGKIIADTSRLLLQAAVVGLLGVLLGVRVSPSAGAMIVAACYLGLFAAAYISLSCLIALRARSHEAMAAFVHVVNMPLFFTSTALVPQKQMPDWLASIAQWNPLSLVVDALRDALLFATPPSVDSGLLLVVLVVLLFSLTAWATRGAARIDV